MSSLLQQLKTLELELHHPGVPCDSRRLQQLLHADFHEVGRSGCAYDRPTIIEFLSAQEASPSVESDNFTVAQLAPDVVLLTYRSVQIINGKVRANHALRSSLWVKSAARWQLRYHQGTSTAQTW